MPRPPLDHSVRDPGFTPRLRDVDALVDLLLDDDLVKHAARAIDRAGVAALGVLRARFEGADPPLRARVLRVIGRFGDDPAARGVLMAALDDPDPKTRRNAAIALGHARGDGVEDALLRAWDRDVRPDMRRSIAASLGKIGTAKCLALLRQASHASPTSQTDDPQLARVSGRAALMVERTESRGQRGRLDAGRVPGTPLGVEILARRGLEGLLAEELVHAAGLVDVRVAGPGQVHARLTGPMEALFAARTMLSFRFPLPTEWLRGDESPVEAIARAAAGDHAARVFAAFTEGAVRYRIDWADGGHRRAASWDTASAIARRAPELVNDPTASLWELTVRTAARFVDVAIAPRALADPRFAWRRRDVPAASHPTIAAALARVAGVVANDVVWDPFVGSGLELVERGLAGPHASLLGSDLDAGALAAARENLRAAGLTATISHGDALDRTPAGVTLVLTNPPMGRRASRVPGLADMLDRFVAHVASVLVAGGRLVWIAPMPARARAAGARAELVLEWASVVDMGGFDAEIQRWVKPA
jgi:23S rRNA G2445 N2-methylase RlmL